MKRTKDRRPAALAPVFLCCLAACASSAPPTPPTPAAAPKAPPTTAELLRTARINGIYEGQVVTLREGLYEGAPFVPGAASRPTVRLLESLTARGDLDGVAGEEIVALVAENSGGSGEQIYLAAFRSQGGALTNIATALLGDRIRLRGLDIDAGTVVLDVVQPGPGEPACCGTQMARKTYRLAAGQIEPVATQVVGRLSLAAVSRLEWTLEEMNGKPIPEGSRAPTFLVQGDAAAGFAGCNRFSGAIEETAPGKVSLGDLAATMMACEDPQMAIEDEYLRSLRQVGSYTFLAGRLALVWEEAGGGGLLLFRRD
jgi:heat shock protein HslJ